MIFVYTVQRKNLRIVYDAVGTLADAVGAELNKVIYESFLSKNYLLLLYIEAPIMELLC